MGAQEVKPAQMSTRTHTNDLRYGGLVYLSGHTGTVYQQITVQENSMPQLVKLITKRKTLVHPYLLTIRNHFHKPQKSSSFSCGNQSKTQMYLEYPYLTRTLQDVIEEYSAKDQSVPEKQVIRIFAAVVQALSFLEKNGTCHGDVKASNILFDHSNTPKLIDSYFVNRGKTAYEIVLENPSSMSLLAPQQLQRVKHRQPEDLTTIHQSQIFMVGLTMLEAMTFEAAMQCYNLDSLQIVEGYHERKQKELSQSVYSVRLCELVLRCIEVDGGQRPSLAELSKSLI